MPIDLNRYGRAGARRLCSSLPATLLAVLAAGAAFASTTAAGASAASEHFACSKPDSAHIPCRFSTPSGNIRCVWFPSPNNVTCELLATHRAYRLHPSGNARSIKINIARRGERLPTNQQLLFTQSLSCHDTKTTMTCNQDFGTGEFKLAFRGSHSA
jgi:hypothetical protein